VEEKGLIGEMGFGFWGMEGMGEVRGEMGDAE